MKRLSRNDIETISEKFVKAYFELPEIKKSQVYRIEPELMLEKVLGLTIEYMHLVRYSDGAKMYSMGMTKFQEVAKDAKACYKIGQLVLVNTEILDKYLETFHITDC